MTYTPENITKRSDLPENAIFVFGSNMAGKHLGGAAKLALDEFGAMEGHGEGLQPYGESYAFPTLNADFSRRTVSKLTTSRNTLYLVAIQYPDKVFYLTRVGLGIAGFSLEEIAPLFQVKLSNFIYPKEFYV
jgi:hypothetical protein